MGEKRWKRRKWEKLKIRGENLDDIQWEMGD